jgi:DNA-binding MurR/RpiR family transcriptional regulator
MTRRESTAMDLYEQLGRMRRNVLAADQVGSRETASVETIDEEDVLGLFCALEP